MGNSSHPNAHDPEKRPRIVWTPAGDMLFATDGQTWAVHHRRLVDGKRRKVLASMAEYRVFEGPGGELRRYFLTKGERTDAKASLWDRQLQRSHPIGHADRQPRHTVRLSSSHIAQVTTELTRRIEAIRREPLAIGFFTCPMCASRFHYQISDIGYIAGRCETTDCLSLYECGGGLDLDAYGDDDEETREEASEAGTNGKSSDRHVAL